MNDKAFLKLPRVLISEPLRSKLSDSAIVLYSYLLSLYELSVRNGERFRDENGRYYVVCPISTVMRLLNCCNNKAESVYMQLENQTAGARQGEFDICESYCGKYSNLCEKRTRPMRKYRFCKCKNHIC